MDETTERGQYTGGWQGSTEVKGLQQEEGFPADSVTETYAAITCEVNTRRPFWLTAT